MLFLHMDDHQFSSLNTYEGNLKHAAPSQDKVEGWKEAGGEKRGFLASERWQDLDQYTTWNINLI